MISLDWQPAKNSDVPIYKQIVDWIKGKIGNGEWPIGSKLPTERALAAALQVNRSTIGTAYDELKAEGMIEAKMGSGTRVVNNTWTLLTNDAPPDWDEYVKTGIYRPNFSMMQTINQAESKADFIRLSLGGPPPELFSAKTMETIFTRIPAKMRSIGYEEPKGLLPLREQISIHLGKRGIDVSPGSILIVSGALQALQLISIGLLKKGSTILLENPSYLQSLPIFQSAGMKMAAIPLDEEGMKPSSIQTISNPSLLYTIPCFHNPTSITMSEKRRKELLDICEQKRLPIVEDDIYRDVWLDEEAPLPLKAMDKNGLVLYLNSMSKSFGAGLRIGWIAGPESVINRLADLKMQIDYGTSSLSQWAVAELLESGLYEEHLQKMRESLKIRRDAALKALQQYMPHLGTWRKPAGGFFIWVKLHQTIPLSMLFEEALKQHLLINPGSLYNQADSTHIRLSYGYESPENLRSGIKELARIIEKCGRK